MLCTQTLKALSSQLILVNQTQASHTLKYHHHVPSSFCYYVTFFDDEVYNPKLVTYTAQSEDDDVVQKFIDMLEEDIKQIYTEYLKRPKFESLKEMIFTESDEVCFQAATECCICGGELGKDGVRNHCHLTGKFRAAAHVSFNMNCQIPKFFAVIFHNLCRYDSHLFIKKLKAKCEDKNEKIKCIAKNKVNCITLSKKVLVDWFMKEVKEKRSCGLSIHTDLCLAASMI